MNEPITAIPPEEVAQLQKKFSEIKHAINNALAVMMALSEMSQRRPDYSEKLASTVLTKAPQRSEERRVGKECWTEKLPHDEKNSLQFAGVHPSLGRKGTPRSISSSV